MKDNIKDLEKKLEIFLENNLTEQSNSSAEHSGQKIRTILHHQKLPLLKFKKRCIKFRKKRRGIII